MISPIPLLRHEAQFMMKDRALMIWLLVVFSLSVLAVWGGFSEVQQQRVTIQNLLLDDQSHRSAEFAKQQDWGSAAYYSFHLTYDEPSDFAFAALGHRDIAAWKHRIRMLALEGQIYEHDAGNPETALIGRFDYAFFVAFVLPLVLVFILYDLRAGERSAGRYHLLVVTSGDNRGLWWARSAVRSVAIFFVAFAPLLVVGFVGNTAPLLLLSAGLLVFSYLLFWTFLCSWTAAWERSSPVILASLIGIWLMFSVIIPAGGRLTIDKVTPIPSGAEILMTQREAVNDAWDLPIEDTMQPFVLRHPEWVNTAEITELFEWKWYYAFQQVGDQKTESLSEAYRAGRAERERLAGWVAWLAPPALFERSFQQLAGTDMTSVLDYEARVRAFHSDLRSFYYPGLFGDEPFDRISIDNLPVFSPEDSIDR